MPQFLVMLYDDRDTLERWAEMTQEEAQRVIAEYAAWSDRLSAEGRLLSSEKLRDETGRVLRVTGEGLQVSDGPFSEAKEVVGGFFILEAANLDEAAQLTRDCPHLAYGGTVAIREIEPLTGEVPGEVEPLSPSLAD